MLTTDPITVTAETRRDGKTFYEMSERRGSIWPTKDGFTVWPLFRMPEGITYATLNDAIAAANEAWPLWVAEIEACGCEERRVTDPHGPRHLASSRCQSGKRPHCTCDTCY